MWGKIDIMRNIAYIFEGEQVIFKEKDFFEILNEKEIIFNKNKFLKYLGEGDFSDIILSEKLDKELFVDSEPEPEPPKSRAERLADFAAQEASKNFRWNSLKSEAEKYLQPFRRLLGVPSNRFAWCGCFAHWCAVESGLYNLPKIAHRNLTFASVYGWMQWAINNNFWISLEKAKKEMPQRGDFVVFDWSDDGSVNHIGIVVESGEKILVAEGNTSNMSAIKDRTAEFNKGEFEGLIRIEEY